MWPMGNGSYEGVPHQNDDWNNTISKPKRRKIEIACTTCRLRKSRCDGGTPKCGACTRRKNVGFECVYLDAGLDRSSQLTARPRLNDGPGSVPSATSNSRDETREPVLYNLNSARPQASTLSAKVSEGGSSTQNVYPVGALNFGKHSTAEPYDANSSNSSAANKDSDWILKAGLLAASSSTKFFNTIFGQSHEQQVQNEISDRAEPTTQESSADKAVHRPIVPRKSIHSADYVLPSRQVADELLDNFFNHVHIQWFDRSVFLRWYEKLWTANTESDEPLDEQINYALLNMIFALVYRTEPEAIAEDQEQLAQAHFIRAQRLLQLDILSFNRLNLLYALFMFLQWYQSINDVQHCNALIRLCIMVAQNIGLDIPEKIAGFKSQRQREMARRAWHGCVLMDRVIAMVSGKPLKISQELARKTAMFQAIDDEYLTGNGSNGEQPQNKPSVHSFFLAFCQLHLILGDILVKSQNDRQERRLRIDLNHILEVDESLHNFAANLPPRLAFETDQQSQKTDGGQVVHLKTRFLYVRILLYRSFFLSASETWKRKDSVPTTRFTDAVTLQGMITCIETAKELIMLLGSQLESGKRGPHLVPQWWHTVAYVYAAVTVIIAAHVFPALLEEITAEALSQFIQTGLQILDILGEQKETAKQCKMALTVLYDRHAKHTEIPKRTPGGTVVTPEVHHSYQDDETNLFTNLGWAFADPLDLFHDRDMVSGDIFATDMSEWT